MNFKLLTTLRALLLFGCFSLSSLSYGALSVFACEPEWASLVKVLLPEADITVATNACQDPHYIEARPSLIAAMNRADFVICTGASLEVGWLPALLASAANPQLNHPETGVFYAAKLAELHQPHDHVDRSMGDVHPEGNPHIQLDPDSIPAIMQGLVDRLVSLQPEEANRIALRHLQWKVRWNKAQIRWKQARSKLAGMSVVVQHSAFHYLLHYLGVKVAIDLEPKPGLPPSVRHLNQLLESPNLSSAATILIAQHQDPQPAQWLSSRAGIAVTVVPGTVTTQADTDQLDELITVIVEQLLKAREQDSR
ncbi:MAG: zinc ABC transporter substrate-binding protein [Pseudomonadales bacterium]|nr:zinc ABC transporter substrate-binding protein [Pseudomonadales bacterium]